MGKAKNKADFQKVKFKVGKKLLKNVNDTKATFKTKTLVLKQQFKDDKSTLGLLTTPHHQRTTSSSLKEIFCQMGHSNQNIRLDAVNKLKDEIGKRGGADVLRHELGHIVENVCPLFSDKDYKVREASADLFRSLVLNPLVTTTTSSNNNNNSNSLEPFFQLISVHLCCAMTHIIEKIQYSSLKILDILVEHKPEFVRAHALSIFDNFVEQISKSDLNGSRRVLKNDPFKFTSTHNWRRNVLTRLSRMLTIVAAGAGRANDTAADEILTAGVCKPVNVVVAGRDDGSKQSIVGFNVDVDRQQHVVDFSKRKSGEWTKEAFKKRISQIISLLADCWIEAKPENNSNVIDDAESLSIMHSVLTAYDVIIDAFDIPVAEFSKHLHIPKHQERQHYFERLLLDNFPYILADNFDFSESTKSDSNQKMSSRLINLLVCKIFASSMISIDEDNQLKMLEYSFGVLGDEKMSGADSNAANMSKAELQTILKIYNIILREFSSPELIEPFLHALISFYDKSHKSSSSHKWLLFQTISRNFLENVNMAKYENLHLVFFKKSLALLISCLKEKNERSEFLIDWIRRSVVQKEKRQKAFARSLNDQYVNILGAADFEGTSLSDSCKKKLLELIYWLPKISQYLFAKLAILILSKNVWYFCKTQVVEILKMRFESDEHQSVINHTDYMVFLMNLFNGYLSFDLLNNDNTTPDDVNNDGMLNDDDDEQRLILDTNKFEHHKKFCNYLESCLSSHRNSRAMLDLLISMSIPVFMTQMSKVYSSTLYGSLSLLSLLKIDPNDGEIDKKAHLRSHVNYNCILGWIEATFQWTLSKQMSLTRAHQLVYSADSSSDAALAAYNNRECVADLTNKFFDLFDSNHMILNDFMAQVAFKTKNANDIESLRKRVILMSFFMKKYSSSLKPCQQAFYNLLNFFQSLNEFEWMQEFAILVQHL